MASVELGTGYDAGGVYSSAQQLGGDVDVGSGLQPDDALREFRRFIREFREHNSFIYRDQLRQNFALGNFFLSVNFDHVKAYDGSLADQLASNPTAMLPLFERAARESVQTVDDSDVPDIQVTFTSGAEPILVRGLVSTHMSTMVRLRGIVISASRTKAKASKLMLQCRTCEATTELSVRSGFSGVQLPRRCRQERTAGTDDCGLDPYTVVPDRCVYADQQTLKLQESPEDVPTGEMPRQLLLSVDRYLVNKVVPGTRVIVTGVYSMFTSGTSKKARLTSLPNPYLRVVGLQADEGGAGRSAVEFSPEEEEELRNIAREPDLYDKISASIDPAIFGHEDIKRAIACLLFGGAHGKTLPDGMRLRGDINVLLLGDPGTAKSQFLKFVERVAPIAVYTSGKGSSAAGLTASVISDPSTREFYLEGGAMVLADGGVVCIDEFDKMREQDRVAIHEAMEQQTISIAKAGITTILNSRTSVLAAANPVFGRYDDLKSAAEQIDFQSTILSRFDMIFIVRDVKDAASDKRIASHVIRIHKRLEVEETHGELDLSTLKKYIAYCRAKCSPRLTEEAAAALVNNYVNVRADVRSQANRDDKDSAAILITVRQLEAIIRITEALAKMELSDSAGVNHVEEAVRLFKASTLKAAETGRLVGEGFTTPEQQVEVERAERQIKRRLPVGSTTSQQNVVDDLVRQGIEEFSVRVALHAMISKGELELRHRRRSITRRR